MNKWVLIIGMILYLATLFLIGVKFWKHSKEIGMETVTMPRELTAENGAKYLLIGEFSEEITLECSECLDVGSDELCEVCGGGITYQKIVPVEWTTIKAIYAMAVKHLAVKS